MKHLEANQANQAVNVTVTVNGTGIVNVIDYSLLVQSALPGCGRSAQGAPFAQLSLRRVGVLQTNVRSFSGEVWQSLAKSSKSSIRIRLRLRIRPGIRLREITLLRKGRCCAARDRRSLLPSRSWRCACARSCSHEKCARWRRIFTAAAKICHLSVRRNRVIRYLFRV